MLPCRVQSVPLPSVALAQVTEQRGGREGVSLSPRDPTGALATGGWGVFCKGDFLGMGGGSRCGGVLVGADSRLQAALWTTRTSGC